MTSETAAIDRAAITHLAGEAAAELGIVGAQVAVAIGDEVAECSVGVENIATGRAVTPDTLFQIGSTTKVFTAVLLMQLADAGLVPGRRARPTKSLPEVPGWGRRRR
ncbi:beta-lactamase family protein [Streptomyces sp. So13.3]|uniref:serine hydrolase n=1 Tax=Streptomyces TaxID=1883 RepID=UPI001105F419|nr:MULTISPECIES: serine hydrolase domain-containing protein [Streptomyces]MCZ4098531.1 serine hydrolase [Streptomyces sp. H39-C1]QNA77438.1 beta-lactamase family protein [Streptomyces sp. So13.3]